MRAIEYGIPHDKEAIQLRLGIAQGFFRDEGLDLSLRVIFGGPEIAAAYDSGALAIGELGSPPATTAQSKGARFRIVASSVRRRALQSFVAHPSIKGWSDLRGRSAAALTIGSCSYWFMREVLARNGLDPDRDLHVIGLGPRYPNVLELLEAGEIQAAVLSEPNISIGEDRGVLRIMQPLTDPVYCPTMQWSVIVANQTVIDREPELVRAVLRGCVRSYRYADAHADEMAAFGAAHFGISRGTMAKSMLRDAPGQHVDGQVDLAGLREAIDLQLRLKAFATAPAIDDIVDLRFLPDAARPVRAAAA